MSGIALHYEAKTKEASYFGRDEKCAKKIFGGMDAEISEAPRARFPRFSEISCEPLDNPGPGW